MSTNALTTRTAQLCMIMGVVTGCLILLGCQDPSTPPKPPASALTPSEIINAAIAAHGGEENFPRARIGRIVMEVNGEFLPGIKGDVTVEDTFDLPGKLKRVVRGSENGKSFRQVTVINGDEGWLQRDQDEPMPLPIVNPGAGHFPSANLDGLVSFNSGQFQLSIGEDPEFASRAHCIEAKVGSQVVGSNFFDKTTHLLVGSKKTLLDRGTEYHVTTTYFGFKTVDGLRIPATVQAFVGKKPLFMMTVKEIEFLKEIDPVTFQKPAAGP